MTEPVRLLYGVDVRAGLASLADESVHCVVTSPPYFYLDSTVLMFKIAVWIYQGIKKDNLFQDITIMYLQNLREERIGDLDSYFGKNHTWNACMFCKEGQQWRLHEYTDAPRIISYFGWRNIKYPDERYLKFAKINIGEVGGARILCTVFVGKPILVGEVGKELVRKGGQNIENGEKQLLNDVEKNVGDVVNSRSLGRIFNAIIYLHGMTSHDIGLIIGMVLCFVTDVIRNFILNFHRDNAPLSHSGTTGEVALQLGRRAVLIDLQAQYLPLAQQRLGLFGQTLTGQYQHGKHRSTEMPKIILGQQ